MEYPRFKMTEIYYGKDDLWKGWYNLCLELSSEGGDSKAIAGPLDPQTSKEVIEALNVQNNKTMARS